MNYRLILDSDRHYGKLCNCFYCFNIEFRPIYIMNKENNKRTFPRLDAQCPVLYQLDNSNNRKVAKMQNLSATGIQMVADEAIASSALIKIQVKPGSKKTIPGIKATGKVVRCEPLDDGKYLISCLLTDVSSGF